MRHDGQPHSRAGAALADDRLDEWAHVWVAVGATAGLGTLLEVPLHGRGILQHWRATAPSELAMARNKQVLRFTVGRDFGPRSAVWCIWTNRDDVYVQSNYLGGAIKTSLHASGRFRHAFSERDAPSPGWPNLGRPCLQTRQRFGHCAALRPQTMWQLLILRADAYARRLDVAVWSGRQCAGSRAASLRTVQDRSSRASARRSPKLSQSCAFTTATTRRRTRLPPV